LKSETRKRLRASEALWHRFATGVLRRWSTHRARWRDHAARHNRRRPLPHGRGSEQM